MGAGGAGEKTVRELTENQALPYRVVGLVDDDPGKKGKAIHNVPVLGQIDSLAEIVNEHKVEEIFIAIPSATSKEMRKIVGACESCGVGFKTLPSIGELIDGKVSIKDLRDVQYEDLLGRPTVKLDIRGIEGYLKDKCVLVTGAGGSIGSELCRQIVRFNPETVVLMDLSETNLYAIQMELEHRVGYLRYIPVLGKVQDHDLLGKVLHRYAPQVVFHAAAYKHVPMLEANPWEAVFNNIIGTRVVMEQSQMHNVDRFVLISTDKAVRPTNVMGASKRVCEMLLQSQPTLDTLFVGVRFGNVTGSSGSVIPLFRDQIARGGPVTVTHPEITRFFMTIPEASRLILQAGGFGSGGEIFILEMGTPVKIAEMARELIILSGKDPDRDIKIEFTGLRPGEKLYEELITEGEGIVATQHKDIMVLKAQGWDKDGGQRSVDSGQGSGREKTGLAQSRKGGPKGGRAGKEGRGNRIEVGGEGKEDERQRTEVGAERAESRAQSGEEYREWLNKGIDELIELAEKKDGCGIQAKLKELVPEYMPQDSVCVL